MKTPTSNLFDLIQSLTKSQKRYIKVQAGSKAKDYIALLDALLAQQTYDEEQLIKDHKGEKFIKHLSVNKQYLYELILKALANFGQQKVEDKVFQRIKAAKILIGKNLFEAAVKELNKGLKLATKFELFALKIIIHNIEKTLLANRQFKKKKELSVERIYKAEADILEQLANTSEYWYLAQQIAQFQLKYQRIQTEEQRSHIEQIIQSPKLQSISLATNFKSKLYFYQANATYQFMVGDVEKAYAINKGFLDLMEEQVHFMKLYSERYLATLNNMLIDSLVIGKFDVLKEGIDRLILIPDRPEFKVVKNIKSRIFRQRYLLLLNWSLRQQEFEKVQQWIPAIEQGLDAYGAKIEKHHRITFYYLIAYTLFQSHHYDQALQWNNKILDTSDENVVKEIFYFARVLNLLIHYELGNYSLLDSLLLSTPKYLKSRRAIYQTEKVLFRFLTRSLNSVDKGEQKKLTIDFKQQIHELFEDPKEKRVFTYLDLRLWLKEL